MVAGVILILSQLSFVIGVFLIIFGFMAGAKEEGPYNWRAVINGKLIGGLFLIVVSQYWIYRLSGSFLLG
jgi:uncharacterized membrane protein